ncbi:MAG: isoprenylcysteine carboxylmethyltransferase family protein [Rhizobiaceae bacterium]
MNATVRPANQRARILVVRAGGLLLVPALLFLRPVVQGDWHEAIEFAGFGLILAAVAGRLWSILYVGSRKNRQLVTSGPYSLTRNPLYVFSTLGAFGFGLIFGSFLMACLLGLAAYAVLSVTAAREAVYLRSVFGAQYDAYAAATPMFWPNLSGYRDQDLVAFSPLVLKRTFVDGLFFAALFPLVELVELAQADGFLPVLASIY